MIGVWNLFFSVSLRVCAVARSSLAHVGFSEAHTSVHPDCEESVRHLRCPEEACGRQLLPGDSEEEQEQLQGQTKEISLL